MPERMGRAQAAWGPRGDTLFAGEMGALMRAVDWSATPLGPLERWPWSLCGALAVCLNSEVPMMIWWGPELVTLYNDACRPMLGTRKHPRALGRPGRECWLDAWSVIGPMLERALWRGEGTSSDDLLLPLDRHGRREEGYFTLSFSPIRDETGRVQGVFTTAAETTRHVLGERRLRTLRDLALHGAETRTIEQACESAIRTLAANPGDIPFALLYLLEADGRRARLAGTTGVSPDVLPSTLELAETETSSTAWPLAQMARTVDLRQAVPFTMPRAVYAAGLLAFVATSLFALRYGLNHRLDLRPPLAKLCPPPSDFGEPYRGEAPPPPPGARTTDSKSGISYKKYDAPWGPWLNNWTAGELKVAYKTGQDIVTEVYRRGEYHASILSGSVPATVNDGVALDLKCTGRQVAGDVRASYYPQPNSQEMLRDEQVNVGGRQAWVTKFRLHFTETGLKATSELVLVALIDVGRPEAAVLYVSIPNTHTQLDWVVDDVLASVRPT